MSKLHLNILHIILLLSGIQVVRAQKDTIQPPVKIGVLTDNYPYSYTDEEGNLTGFAFELADKVMQTMNIKHEKTSGVTSEINLLYSKGKLDILQSFAKSDSRDSLTLFSVPYLVMTGQVFASKKLKNIKNLIDLKGYKILVHKGSLGETVLKNAGLGSSIQYAESVENAFKLINEGKGDATLASHLSGFAVVNHLKLKNVKALKIPIEDYKVEYCIAVKKGNHELLEKVNEGLAVLVRTGEFENLYEKWFGFIEPVGYSAEQILLVIVLGLLLALIIAAWAAIRISAQAKMLKEGELKYHSIYDHLDIAIFLTRPSDGKILAVNPFACKMFDATEEEICNMGSEEMNETANTEYKKLIKVREEKGVAMGELNLYRKDGTKFPAHVCSSTFKDKKGELLATIIVRDLTEEKEMLNQLITAKNKAEESDRLKTAFLHNISHEIRTPMNSIIGFSEIINQPDISPVSRKQFTDIIIQNTYRLLDFVNDMIYMSTIFSGQLTSNKDYVDITKLLYSLYSHFLTQAENKNIILNKPQITILEDVKLFTDSVMLKTVMTKLLDNAVKFTIRGSITFGCTTYENEVVFYVEDTGTGIHPDNHKNLFKKFYQHSQNNFVEGAGMGLPICKGIIEHLGGSINFTSQPNLGSRFYFTLGIEK